MNNRHAKIAVSLFALAVLVARQAMPNLLDATDMVIMAVGLLPWLSSLIKSAELPGGVKIEFQDLASAGKKVTGAGATAPDGTSELDFVTIASTDANLALVALRIEIEKRVRKLAVKHGIPSERVSVMRLFRELQAAQVLSDLYLSGLQELVMFGNQAAHGADVEKEAAQWAVDFGPGVISALDDAIAS